MHLRLNDDSLLSLLIVCVSDYLLPMLISSVVLGTVLWIVVIWLCLVGLLIPTPTAAYFDVTVTLVVIVGLIVGMTVPIVIPCWIGRGYNLLVRLTVSVSYCVLVLMRQLVNGVNLFYLCEFETRYFSCLARLWNRAIRLSWNGNNWWLLRPMGVRGTR